MFDIERIRLLIEDGLSDEGKKALKIDIFNLINELRLVNELFPGDERAKDFQKTLDSLEKQRAKAGKKRTVKGS
jgi:hypothetical protein